MNTSLLSTAPLIIKKIIKPHNDNSNLFSMENPVIWTLGFAPCIKVFGLYFCNKNQNGKKAWHKDKIKGFV